MRALLHGSTSAGLDVYTLAVGAVAVLVVAVAALWLWRRRVHGRA